MRCLITLTLLSYLFMSSFSPVQSAFVYVYVFVSVFVFVSLFCICICIVQPKSKEGVYHEMSDYLGRRCHTSHHSWRLPSASALCICAFFRFLYFRFLISVFLIFVFLYF